MSLKSKTYFIRDKTWVDDSLSENTYFDFYNICCIGTLWNMRNTNYAKITSGNELGDACITERSIITDGDLVFSVGWGDGFVIRKLDNTGSLSIIYSDAQPANSYGSYTSLALDKPRKKAYVGNYVYNNFTVYDYTDSGSVVKDGQITEAANGLPSDAAGAAYNNGLEVVGDWLYINNGDKTSTSMFRWHVVSQSADNLAVYNVGSAARYGAVYYEQARDRLWLTSQANGDIWVVSSASLSSSAETPPSASCLKVNSLGLGDDMYCSVVVPDNDDPNVVTVSGRYMRTIKINIAGILMQVSTSATVVSKNDSLYNVDLLDSPLWVNGYHAGYPHPVYGSDLIILNPNRDFLYMYGWLDQERFVPVGPRYYYGYGFNVPKDQTTVTPYISNQSVCVGYGTLPTSASSLDGTWYWVKGGYAGAFGGYRLYTYSHSFFPNGMALEPSGVLAFGTFYLDNSSSIGSCRIQGVSESSYTPVGTNFYTYVSNDGGTNWELYDYATEELYNFTSSGNAGKVKFVFSGSHTKTPYFCHQTFFSFTFNGYDAVDSNIITTYASLNIQGV